MKPLTSCVLGLVALALLAGCGSTIAAGRTAVLRVGWRWPHKDPTSNPAWDPYAEQRRVLAADDLPMTADATLRLWLTSDSGPAIYPGVGHPPLQVPFAGRLCGRGHSDGRGGMPRMRARLLQQSLPCLLPPPRGEWVNAGRWPAGRLGRARAEEGTPWPGVSATRSASPSAARP